MATTAVGRCEEPDVRASLRAGTRGPRSPPSRPIGALSMASVQAARSSSLNPLSLTVIHSRYLSSEGKEPESIHKRCVKQVPTIHTLSKSGEKKKNERAHGISEKIEA